MIKMFSAQCGGGVFRLCNTCFIQRTVALSLHPAGLVEQGFAMSHKCKIYFHWCSSLMSEAGIDRLRVLNQVVVFQSVLHSVLKNRRGDVFGFFF